MQHALLGLGAVVVPQSTYERQERRVIPRSHGIAAAPLHIFSGAVSGLFGNIEASPLPFISIHYSSNTVDTCFDGHLQETAGFHILQTTVPSSPEKFRDGRGKIATMILARRDFVSSKPPVTSRVLSNCQKAVASQRLTTPADQVLHNFKAA